MLFSFIVTAIFIIMFNAVMISSSNTRYSIRKRELEEASSVSDCTGVTDFDADDCVALGIASLQHQVSISIQSHKPSASPTSTPSPTYATGTFDFNPWV